jgi:hypothetical protein
MTSKTILPEFQTFLIDKKLVPESKVSFYAFWVSKFLAFLNKNNSENKNNFVPEFIGSLEKDRNVADWQVRQTREASALYLDHYKGINLLKGLDEKTARNNILSILTLMKDIIRTRHYSYSMECARLRVKDSDFDAHLIFVNWIRNTPRRGRVGDGNMYFLPTGSRLIQGVER